MLKMNVGILVNPFPSVGIFGCMQIPSSAFEPKFDFLILFILIQ